MDFCVSYLHIVTILSHQVINAAILEQTFIVEFTVFNQMCIDCQKKETNNFWKAVVQVRQKVRVMVFVNCNRHVPLFLLVLS